MEIPRPEDINSLLQNEGMIDAARQYIGGVALKASMLVGVTGAVFLNEWRHRGAWIAAGEAAKTYRASKNELSLEEITE